MNRIFVVTLICALAATVFSFFSGRVVATDLAPVRAIAPAASPSASSEPELSATPEPFWRAKEKIYKKMTDDRYIAVSAKSDSDGEKKTLVVSSAGILHAPVDFSNETIAKFADYPKYVPYIVETSYDATTKNLFVHGAILGFHERMTLHLQFEEHDGGRQIFWRSVGGGFVGMTGLIDEKKIDYDHTEISLFATYTGKSLGLPAVILDWGLEFAAQRASGAMRSHIESEWETAKKR